jgi:hypothetical protein
MKGVKNWELNKKILPYFGTYNDYNVNLKAGQCFT